MVHKRTIVTGLVLSVGLALACGHESNSPTSPSRTSGESTTANRASVEGTNAVAAADGSTLKATAPGLSSPIGNARLTTQTVTLAISAASLKFGQGATLLYRVQLLNSAGALLEEKTGTGMSYAMGSALNVNTQYKWRARAEYQGAVGPWSATESFMSMERPVGYVRGTEVFDPLTDGTTVGTIVGPVTWLPGRGVRLDSDTSWIQYTLSQPLTAGEYSAVISGLSSDGPEVKTKVMAMREGDEDITTNEYRFTIEKRGNGVIAWRLIAGNDDQIDTVGAERVQMAFHENQSYFFKATWGGAFNLLIREGGVNGSDMYEFGKGYDGAYQPNPHNVYAGCPFSPRSGGQTAAGMIISRIWVSSNPRPVWADQ
jgi:hypothetical protein